MEPRLAGRTALVTGAASGIGRAVTDRFVADGAVVVAGDVDTDGLERLSVDHGDRVIAVECDVTDETSMAALVASRPGPTLDVVVANAGRGTFGMIVDQSVEEWRSVLDLCLTGVFLTMKHTGPVIAPGGSIVTIASLNAIQPSAGMAVYCAAKAGASMLSQVAAMEFGPRGIRVNTVAPGLVETAATAPFFLVPGVVEEFVENTTLGRFAQPTDVANLVSFLASDEAGFVSGGFFSVDGGASTKRYPDLPGAFARLASGAAE